MGWADFNMFAVDSGTWEPTARKSVEGMRLEWEAGTCRQKQQQGWTGWQGAHVRSLQINTETDTQESSSPERVTVHTGQGAQGLQIEENAHQPRADTEASPSLKTPVPREMDSTSTLGRECAACWCCCFKALQALLPGTSI